MVAKISRKQAQDVHLRMNISFTLQTIHNAALAFWQQHAGARVFAFHGEMGAGKTTFIHALCMVRGVKETMGSPTFSIINEYRYNTSTGSHSIFHLDLYRLNSEGEAMQAGVEDCLYSDAICLVEWPERAPAIFPPETIHVRISLAAEGERILSW